MGRVDRKLISAAASQTVPFRQMIKDLASAAGRKPFLLPVPWRIPFYGLRAIEAVGVRIGFRSDSIVSLVEANPHPAFTMEGRFRNFSVADL